MELVSSSVLGEVELKEEKKKGSIHFCYCRGERHGGHHKKILPQKGAQNKAYQMQTGYDEKFLLQHRIYFQKQEIDWDRPHYCDESFSKIDHDERFFLLLDQKVAILIFLDYPSVVKLKEWRCCKHSA